MATIERREYLQWQSTVIRLIYEPTARVTQLVPVDGAPSVLLRHKFLLVALADANLPAQVADGASGPEPKKITCAMHDSPPAGSRATQRTIRAIRLIRR